METSDAVAGTVAQEMARRKISQNELARVTTIPLATLNRRLSGVTPFTVRELDLIAQALGTTVSALIAGGEAA